MRFFSTGFSEIVLHMFLLQTGSKTAMITGHLCHYLPTLSLEHLNLSIKSNLCSPTLLTYSILVPRLELKELV
jgi:hypothetical protein